MSSLVTLPTIQDERQKKNKAAQVNEIPFNDNFNVFQNLLLIDMQSQL